MTNHNSTPERHDHPFQANDKSRTILKRSLMAVGGLALAYVMTNNYTANPEKHLEHFTQTPEPLVNEAVYENGPNESLSSIISIVEEGDATSSVVEEASLRLAVQEDIELKEGQSAVNHESSLYIDSITHQLTGGAVQPGDKIESWLDPATGYIVSTHVISDAK